MRATFQNTVDILVKAYLNDTLEHYNCYACAVGNIVASCNNISFRKQKDKRGYGRVVAWLGFDSIYEESVSVNEQEGNWMSVIPGYGQIRPLMFKGKTALFINKTGYTIEHLALIESVFESHSEDTDAVFAGLMAVVDVLAEIHGISLESKESAKALFVKA